MTLPILFLLALLLFIAWLLERGKRQHQQKNWNAERARFREQIATFSGSLARAERRVQELQRYEAIEHAEAEAQRLKAAAEGEAQRIINTSGADAKKLRDAFAQEAAQARAELRST